MACQVTTQNELIDDIGDRTENVNARLLATTGYVPPKYIIFINISLYQGYSCVVTQSTFSVNHFPFREIRVVERKDATCLYWVVIVLLAAAILTVLFI